MTHATGASLLDDAPQPTEPAKKGRGKKKLDPSDMPPPAPPTDVQLAVAQGEADAATLGGRPAIAGPFTDLFDEEEQAVARARDEAGGDRAKLKALLDAHALLEAERDRLARAKVAPLILDGAAAGHALEEVEAWAQRAERAKRMYGAMIEAEVRRAERVRATLWPLVLDYCSRTPRKKGLKSWSFPTTDIEVVESESRVGHLEVLDHERASSALLKLVDPVRASEAVKVTSQVYVREALALLADAGVDLSKTTPDGFRWTPPGQKTTTTRRRA